MMVLTTGQVAKICRTTPRTVSKWFDTGRIRGYRIPGSQDRRIPRAYLIRFLKEHDPKRISRLLDEHGLARAIERLEDDTKARVLILTQDQALQTALKAQVMPLRPLKFAFATGSFEAGMLIDEFRPDCLIVDLAIGSAEALLVARNIRRRREFSEVYLIALIPEPEDRATDLPGINVTLKKPVAAAELTERILTEIGMRKELTI